MTCRQGERNVEESNKFPTKTHVEPWWNTTRLNLSGVGRNPSQWQRALISGERLSGVHRKGKWVYIEPTAPCSTWSDRNNNNDNVCHKLIEHKLCTEVLCVEWGTFSWGGKCNPNTREVLTLVKNRLYLPCPEEEEGFTREVQGNNLRSPWFLKLVWVLDILSGGYRWPLRLTFVTWLGPRWILAHNIFKKFKFSTVSTVTV